MSRGLTRRTHPVDSSGGFIRWIHPVGSSGGLNRWIHPAHCLNKGPDQTTLLVAAKTPEKRKPQNQAVMYESIPICKRESRRLPPRLGAKENPKENPSCCDLSWGAARHATRSAESRDV